MDIKASFKQSEAVIHQLVPLDGDGLLYSAEITCKHTHTN
jgi:hypothetical protein